MVRLTHGWKTSEDCKISNVSNYLILRLQFCIVNFPNNFKASKNLQLLNFFIITPLIFVGLSVRLCLIFLFILNRNCEFHLIFPI